MAKYKGLSSKNFLQRRSFVLTDKELIKQDLLNRLFCSRVRGERVMMEGWGTAIPDTPFEPLDDETISAVIEDIEFVFNRDPRIVLRQLQPMPDFNENRLTVACRYDFVELSGSDQLDLYLVFNE